MLSRIAILCVPVSLVALACSSVPERADETGTTAEDLSTADAIARGELWVNAQLHYCQAPNHQRDYDSACSTICNRTSNAQWDPYRSDCSGFVSWAWDLPAPGRVTGEFAPFQNDITHAIPASTLREGDAVNNSDHIMLFKSWVTPGKTAIFLEEPGCSVSQPYARQVTSNVTINGNSISLAFNGMTFTAIRYSKLTVPVPDVAPKGTLDTASCTAITGWAQDADVATKPIAVDLYFDAPVGKLNAQGPLHVTADVNRPDLCTPLGSCDHGFSAALPLAVQDGAAHTIYAYGVDSTGAIAPTLLTSSGKSITCAAPGIPASNVQGEKRHIVNATVLNAWGLGDRLEIAHEPAATVAGYAQGPDLPATPDVIISDDGSPDVWVVDGTSRRHVQNPASMTAWHFAAPKKTPAAQVQALATGADWPNAPFVFEGVGAPDVFVLDSAPGQPPITGVAPSGSQGSGGSGTGAGSGTTGNGQGSEPAMNGATDPMAVNVGDAPAGSSGGGCALGASGDPSSDAGFGLGLLFALGLVVRRKRR